jgi:site-specific recombinase XerD
VVALVLPATGLRIGEFCGLNLSDVAIEEGLFCFHVGNKISKTGVARDVWFSSDGYAGEAFKSHLYERMADANRRGLGDAPLFINVYGRRLTPFRVEERYRQAKKALGIRGRCTPHVNRHTFASFLIQEKGVDAKTVSELTGHSVETLLHVYTHVSVKKKKAVARDCVIV